LVKSTRTIGPPRACFLDRAICPPYAIPDAQNGNSSSQLVLGLAESFSAAQEKEDPQYQAVLALAGWIGARGPCYRSLDHGHAYARIKNLAKKSGFTQLPAEKKVKKVWQLAHARWKKLSRHEVEASPN